MLRLLLLLGLTSVCSSIKFYRKDYTYIVDYDAFYKIHWDKNGTSWDSAFLTCDEEDSTLFYPQDKSEWTVVRKLTENMVEKPDLTEFFVGVHNEFEFGEFMTVDGETTSSPMIFMKQEHSNDSKCVFMDLEKDTYKMGKCEEKQSNRPFVCKKVEDVTCPTIDHNYKYIKETRKCYKVHSKSSTWLQAMKTCFTEGGLLAVVEDADENKIIADMMLAGTKYYLGYHKILYEKPFYTVKGKVITRPFERDYSNYGGRCAIAYKERHMDKLHQRNIPSANNNAMEIMSHTCSDSIHFICEMETRQ